MRNRAWRWFERGPVVVERVLTVIAKLLALVVRRGNHAPRVARRVVVHNDGADRDLVFRLSCFGFAQGSSHEFFVLRGSLGWIVQHAIFKLGLTA